MRSAMFVPCWWLLNSALNSIPNGGVAVRGGVSATPAAAEKLEINDGLLFLRGVCVGVFLCDLDGAVSR